jgi:hypothetical protein
LYLQRDPRDADAHYGLAESLKAANEPLAAAEAYEEYAKVERRPGQAKWIQKAEETAKQLRAGLEGEKKAPLAAAVAKQPLNPPKKQSKDDIIPVEDDFPPETAAAAAPTKAAKGDAKKPAANDVSVEVTKDEDDAVATGAVLAGPRPESFTGGIESLKQGDYAGALPKLAAAAKEAPEDALVLAALAGAHLGLEHGPEAEATYRRALAGASADAVPAIYFGIGESLRFQGENKKALETYELAMKHEAATANLKKLLSERIDALK